MERRSARYKHRVSQNEPSPAFWAALASAAAALKARWQLTRVEYNTGFVAPWEVSVWLGTETDDERDRLARRPNLERDVGNVLTEHGLSDAGGVYRGLVVQSEETVKREYRGSWFYALR